MIIFMLRMNWCSFVAQGTATDRLFWLEAKQVGDFVALLLGIGKASVGGLRAPQNSHRFILLLPVVHSGAIKDF